MHASLLNACLAALDLAPTSSIQLHHVPTLLTMTAHLPGQGGPDATVRSWAETQGYPHYLAPPIPYPLHVTTPAILWGVDAAHLPALRTLLAWRYPPDQPVTPLHHDPAGRVTCQTQVTLATLEAAADLFYLPALPITQNERDPEGLVWVVARLLGPGGCPWDVRQTHQSLRGALLEEAHEVLEALDAGDMIGLSEELGDLLLNILAHSEIARQHGAFSLPDVVAQVTRKIIGRHPHVFGDQSTQHEGQIHQRWEQIKATELAAKGRERSSALDGVPAGMPALAAAQKLGKKAARTGFAWFDATSAWAKLHEELDELKAATQSEHTAHVAEEMGDLLFITARLASYLGVDAEAALRSANQKFRRRFTFIETHAAAQGRTLADMSLEEMIACWNQAKNEEKGHAATNPDLPR
ncbi:MazG family protein [Oscillochloris trichoides DG-6]|uniref:MazG family protein n=1 Tax=Oscillochloris trichoides DG-6 TaxID=765420 RepID=E1I9W5_9CHLR|nr:nucleoside triphosphate pyrophosphohydrolase [Oscillochloris trichoides]EFO81967.1 MazG family protein [Oscillochloris trichoides DG-6]